MKKSNTGTILLVEDEASISKVCSQVLTEMGYRVDIAINARIAQEILDIREYDLCLIDVRTPSMNGIELYEWLTKEHPRQAGRVIFTSGDIYDKETKEQINFSSRPFLPKPFDIKELKAVVEEFFKEKQQ